MKKIVLLLTLALVSINAFGFGFKIRMDQTYNSAYKDGKWVEGDILNVSSIVTINNEDGWIYFNTADIFFSIEAKNGAVWNCKDSNGDDIIISITRENLDSYLTITIPEKMAWCGRITKEKAIWKPIRKPFGIPFGSKFTPERIPMFRPQFSVK